MQEVLIDQEAVEREKRFFEQNLALLPKIIPFIWSLVLRTVYRQGTEFKVSKMKLKRSDGSIVHAIRILDFNDPENLLGPKGFVKWSTFVSEGYSALSEVLKQLPLVFYLPAENKQTGEVYRIEWRIMVFHDEQGQYLFRIQYTPNLPLTREEWSLRMTTCEGLHESGFEINYLFITPNEKSDSNSVT